MQIARFLGASRIHALVGRRGIVPVAAGCIFAAEHAPRRRGHPDLAGLNARRGGVLDISHDDREIGSRAVHGYRTARWKSPRRKGFNGMGNRSDDMIPVVRTCFHAVIHGYCHRRASSKDFPHEDV